MEIKLVIEIDCKRAIFTEIYIICSYNVCEYVHRFLSGRVTKNCSIIMSCKIDSRLSLFRILLELVISLLMYECKHLHSLYDALCI